MNKLNSSENKSKQTAPAEPSDSLPPPITSMDEAVDRFAGFVRDGVQAWTRAGKLLLQMQMKDSNVFNKIIAKNEWLTIDTLMTFTRIGRMEMRPEVLLLNTATGNKVMRLGYSQQCKLLDGRVTVATDIDRDGKALLQQKKLSDMTQRDLETLIDGGKTRTLTQQEQYLRHKAAQKNEVVIRPVIQQAFKKPDVEKKVMFLGCWRIVMRGGIPQLSKAATLPLNAQRILLKKNMGDVDAFIELTRWSDDE